MKRFLAVALLAPLVGAVPVRAADTSRGSPEAGYKADDTGRNVRDREDATKTPGDQSNDETDLRITREIRKAVVDDGSLSTNAHNVKIITVDRVVTLRGPVNDANEKASIAAKARKVEGVKKVEDHLEITKR